ncbi:MAG: hypothetical protein ACJA2S_005542 [Cyclobacteriaceae bacterium]|jgi:hypothetical protein
MGRYFLSEVKRFETIVLVEAIAEPIDMEYNLMVKKVYKGNIEEAEMIKLGGGFCSDFIFAKKGEQFILGLRNEDSEFSTHSLSRCTTSKIFVNEQLTFVKNQRLENGQPRIGFIKRKMKLERLEKRLKSKI